MSCNIECARNRSQYSYSSCARPKNIDDEYPKEPVVNQKW